MIESTPVRTLSLANGLTLQFHEAGNRYFGDFHRVVIVVEGIVDVESADLSAEQKHLIGTLPDPVLLYRELERMGVTTEKLDDTAHELIDSFIDSARSYLERQDIPGRLLEKRLSEKKRR